MDFSRPTSGAVLLHRPLLRTPARTPSPAMGERHTEAVPCRPGRSFLHEQRGRAGLALHLHVERFPAQTRDPFGVAGEHPADLIASGWVPEKYLSKRGSKRVTSGHAHHVNPRDVQAPFRKHRCPWGRIYIGRSREQKGPGTGGSDAFPDPCCNQLTWRSMRPDHLPLCLKRHCYKNICLKTNPIQVSKKPA